MMMQRVTTALVATVAAGALMGVAHAETVKIGALGGITGPIESLAPPIIDAAQFAIQQVNDQGGFFEAGDQGEIIVGDTGCADATKAADAADRLVNVENVVAIMGPMCSGATVAAANNAGVPGGAVMISPSATSPAVTEIDDNDLVFRTVVSDAYQGDVLARLIRSKDVDTVAVTYVNNDYGKGFADSFTAAFEAEGGTVTASEAHEEGKADYRAEIGSLSATGAGALVVLAYADGSGQTIVRQALEGGDFQTFFGGDGMVSDTLAQNVPGVEGKITFTRPSSPDVPGLEVYAAAMAEAGLPSDGTFVANAYDAAFIIALAIEQAGSTDRAAVAEAVRSVASEPGETIMPGEWQKAKELIAAGQEINYEGATGSLEFDDNGDVPGVFVEVTIKDGAVVNVAQVE